MEELLYLSLVSFGLGTYFLIKFFFTEKGHFGSISAIFGLVGLLLMSSAISLDKTKKESQSKQDLTKQCECIITENKDNEE